MTPAVSSSRLSTTLPLGVSVPAAAGPLNLGVGWNAENQLVRVCKNATPPCTDANALALFAYDPLGRRVEKVAGGVTTTWTYDGEDMLREARGGTVFRYVHGPGIDEPLARIEGTNPPTYYHADGLGSIVKMTDAAGAVTLTRQYDAWGNLEIGADQPGYAFTAREWDSEINLYYYRARYYDPKVGRFINEDPIGFDAGVNLWVYVNANPIRWIDPMGLYQCGSGWNEAIVPEHCGSVDFSACCRKHDSCYEDCGKSKRECDDQFYDCLVDACLKAPVKEQDKCLKRAGQYGGAVLEKGGKAFRNAQKKCRKGKPQPKGK